jgi:predicted ATPase/DNA-binding SARP family transcriptional activator
MVSLCISTLCVGCFWDSGAVQIRILGPLEVRDGAATLEVAGSRLRRLLIRLALDAGRPVSAAALVDAVWDAAPPADEANALQSLISRLRRALGGAGYVGQSAAGYRLAVSPDDIDAHRFEQLARDGAAALRRREHATAARTLRDAVAAARLGELHLAATQDRVDADLALGDATRVVADLDVLADAHPLDERIAGQRMSALAKVGRQADALAAYDGIRALLADELGVDPSAGLQAIHLAVLRGDPAQTRPATSRSNLRAQLTSFVGREDEMARIGKLLDENRLVTLVGPGGAGKTRLAVEAAAMLLDDVPDGIWFVELATVTDAADVPQTVLGSLGLRESHLLEQPTKLTPRDAMGRMLEALADRRLVVILDNCEHLVDATAQLADQLLAHCRDLRILTTSREPLGIFGESLLVVPPLGQPAPSRQRYDSGSALQHAAVRLFADRAVAVSPEFRVDDANVETVVEIVRRLDGLPLAIELAAARLRSLPVGEIAARLNDRFRLLTGGSRTALPRHRTLRAVVEWSWDLLSVPERLLVERFAVFPAGATPHSAEAVCADGDAVGAADVLDLLASLVDKSLLQESAAPDQSGARYRMLETIREYGHDRMLERRELTRIRDAHARYFADLVREADPHLRRPEQLGWMARLNTERDNILAALRHLGEQGDAQAALEMAVSMGWYWSLLGSHAEALTWISFALDVPGPADPDIRLLGEAIQILNSASTPGLVSAADVETGMQRLGDLSMRLDAIDSADRPILALMKPIMAMFADDSERVGRLIEEAIANPDPWVAAAARSFRSAIAENNGDVAQMRVDAEQAVRDFRQLGERWGLANSLQMYAHLKTVDGELDTAVASFEEALALVVEMGAREDEAMMQVRLADLHMRRGDMAAARVHVEKGLEISDAAGSTMESMFAGAVLAECARLAGDFGEARRLRDDSMRRFAQIPDGHPIQGHGKALILAIAAKQDLVDGAVEAARETLQRAADAAVCTKDMPIMAAVGVAVADLALRTGNLAQAAEMLGAATRLRGADDATQLDVKRITAALREQCGDDGFEAAYERGRALDRDAAIARLTPASLVPE